MPGVHNVLNALSVISLGEELGIDPKTVAAALSGYRGVKRRFEVVGEVGGAKIVEDAQKRTHYLSIPAAPLYEDEIIL